MLSRCLVVLFVGVVGALLPSPTRAFTPTQTLDEAAVAQVGAVRLTPPQPVPECDVPCIIRVVWPDQLEDRALRIAYRESRYQTDVHTSCCWGVFQIHTMHLAWLCPEIACSIADLKDPWLNTMSAYALYQRDGWGPWAT